ncbi:hypothetical protein N7468_005967 [Penicillium chermesinum]|uniref:NADH:flavin oxidoreductase/NADH oxidase N-terminal domain-containing protein n=1 Tax=Penicillium chermesinum TaxID=63820 RepID=A0A9W9P059_9EURO|nr:uncharacterized protein N7468_005967 [Penicillium chermesinum]KAJ5233011.1 hypothetical protein N7468_005967 [Penicillium chermesinum]
MPSPLADPVTLPCGLVFRNRLSKAAMAEALGGKSHSANETLTSAYVPWAKGGWGSILTGNVHVDVNHLGSPDDPALHTEYNGDPALVAQWKQYADACQEHGVPTLVQVCHPGRQSFRGAGTRGLFGQSVAPSAVPVKLGDGLFERLLATLLWNKPREMTKADIERVVRQFVDTARLMADAGFSGIELHGAHGYLIVRGFVLINWFFFVDQFLNPKTNIRTDEYGGTPEKRAKFVLDIIAEIRKVVPPKFAIGIKLNSADHSSATFEETMTQIKLLAEAGIDFLEISGGSYEDPKMMGISEPKSERTAAREAFFLEFAKTVRSRYPELVLMLTGGFRSRTGAESAVRDNACDLVGIGRPAAVDPHFAALLLDESVPEEKAVLPLKKAPTPWILRWIPLKIVGAGAETLYYASQIGRIAKGLATFAPGM